MDKIKLEDLKKQDDDSLESLQEVEGGEYYKFVNTYPYRPIRISKEEFENSKKGLQKIKLSPDLKPVISMYVKKE